MSKKKESFWETEVGKRTWVALVTKQISQSEAARIPGAPGQSAISQRLIKHQAKPREDLQSRVALDRCPVCGLVEEFKGLAEEEKVRFRRLLSTERNT